MTMSARRLLCLLGILIALGGQVVQARVRCFSIFDCEHKIRKGSECVDGFCTNPFHVGGCLSNWMDDHYKVRTCNSDDPPSAVELGHCRPSALDYMEVRVASQNWESAFFVAWVLQILLSELMDVPVSIETGVAGKNVDFYDINTSFDYGSSNNWAAVKTSKEVRDCRLVKGSEEYTPCQHVVPGAFRLN